MTPPSSTVERLREAARKVCEKRERNNLYEPVPELREALTALEAEPSPAEAEREILCEAPTGGSRKWFNEQRWVYPGEKILVERPVAAKDALAERLRAEVPVFSMNRDLSVEAADELERRAKRIRELEAGK